MGIPAEGRPVTATGVSTHWIAGAELVASRAAAGAGVGSGGAV
jgi:hypothetical protein